MQPQQSAAYLERLRERITAIRQSSIHLKTKITGSIDRKGLGSSGESARKTSAISLGAHYSAVAAGADHGAEEEEDSDNDNMGPLNRSDGRARSDSMEPLTPPLPERESYIGYHSLNSTKMRKMKLEELGDMYAKGGTFATVSLMLGGRQKLL
jgi:hypothetical protein